MLFGLEIALSIALIGVAAGIAISVLIGVSYVLFCTPYLWWFSDHCPPDKRPRSLIRDYRNAFRYYRSLITRKPPVLL